MEVKLEPTQVEGFGVGGGLPLKNDQPKIHLAGNVRNFDDFPVTLSYNKGGKRGKTGEDKMCLTC